MAYKGKVDDTRNSSPERIVGKLMELRAEVAIYNPNCQKSFEAKRAKDISKAVKGADCTILVAAHKMFEGSELESIRALMRKNPVIVEGRRIVTVEARNKGFIYVGIGCCARERR